MLKRIILFFITFYLVNNFAYSQRTTDFGILLGRSYYLGEVNPKRHHGKGVGSFTIGAMLRRNLNERYSIKANLNRTTLKAEDDVVDFAFNQIRNASFETKLTEFSASIEFNFLPYRNGTKKGFTPYIFVGASMVWYNPETFVNGVEVVTEETDSKSSLALPFGPGFRLSLGNKVSLGFEWGFRRTNNDYIDGLPNLKNDIQELSKEYDTDWFVVTGFTLTYRISKVGKCPYYYGF